MTWLLVTWLNTSVELTHLVELLLRQLLKRPVFGELRSFVILLHGA
jgi:hypothetical protein